jgi:uncharacterized RDD family membrane protein YckC
MFCPKCGAELKEGGKFCSSCGAPIEPIKKSGIGKRFCPKCGAELREEDIFCSSCRTRISKLDMEKAGAGARLASFILDVIIIEVVWIIYVIFNIVFSIGGIALVAAVFILTIGYFTYFFGNGQTPGMKIMKIKLCGTDGTYPIGYARGFLRWVDMIISGLILDLGYFWILIDKDKQGWHDKIADTYVVTV